MSMTDWIALGIAAGILTTLVVLFWKMSNYH
jgi:hypothetical protein